VAGADCPLSICSGDYSGPIADPYRESQWSKRYESRSVPGRLAEDCAPSRTLTSKQERPTVVRVGLVAYARSMWNLFWSALIHPTKTTEIDLMTGRVVRHF
jgi:hypothetical protein